MSEVRVGISGWTYPGWRGRFYPRELPPRRYLEHVARQLDTVELNGSFYSLQRPESYRRWREETPPGFLFAVKGSRFISHNKKLGDTGAPLANFFASGVLALEEKLGPILWQLSGNLRCDPARLDAFLGALPRDTEEAVELARRHDARLEGRAWTRTEGRRPLRYALEPRHPSFFGPELVGVLRRHDVALCFSHSASWPYAEELTAGFVYLRLHGGERTYASEYGPALPAWAARIRRWAAGSEPEDAVRLTDAAPPAALRGRDVFAYFDNDAHGHAPFDAVRLAELLEVGPAAARTRAVRRSA